MTTASLDKHLHQTHRETEGTPLKKTLTFGREFGPLVVDIWPARRPSGALPVLLIHGWGASGHYWDSTADALAESVMVVVPDFPGAGRSMPLERTMNLYDQVEAMLGLLDELGINQVQVVGHSMGAAIALLMADAQPDRFLRLVLISMCLFANSLQQSI